MNIFLNIIRILFPIIATIILTFISISFSRTARDKYKILKAADGKQHIYFVVAIILYLIGGTVHFYLDIKYQTNFISKVEIAELADRSMWRIPYGGDRNSFETIRSLKEKYKNDKELNEIISINIDRVHQWYKSSTKNLFLKNLGMTTICKLHSDCIEKEPETGFDAKNVFEHLSYPEWQSRARAAYIIRNYTTAPNIDEINREEVLEKLKYLMKKDNENSLLVSQTALETYSILTNESHELFDFEM